MTHPSRVEPPPVLRGETVVVTGAAGGIGRGIARRMAQAGAQVVVHHRSSASRARALAEQIEQDGGRAVVAQGDVRDPDECAAVVATAVDAFGGLTALVNNAGVQPVEALDGMSAEQWRTVVDVNLTGTFAMTQAAAAAMTDGRPGRGGAGSPSSTEGPSDPDGPRPHGSIIHIASVEAGVPARGHAHYSSAKAAVVMHARAAALELGHLGIRVNTVSPGLIDTGHLIRDWPAGHDSWTAAAPLGRTGTPEDVGDACVFLTSPLARWISGHDLVVDGGMSAVPAW